jgi:integrase
MAVYKFRDKWKAEVFVDGRRVDYRLCTTKREAQTWHDEVKARHRAGDTPVKTKVAFEEVLKRFETEHLPTVRPASQRAFRSHLERRIKPHFRFYSLAKLTPELVEEFKRDLLAQVARGKLSPKTVNDTLHLLRLILNQAVSWKLIRQSPYEAKSLKVQKKEDVGWEKEDDARRFLAHAGRSRYALAYWLVLETGLRYAEVVGLHWDDIDLAGGVVHVRRQWVEADLGYGDLKDSEMRSVAFNPEGEFAGALREGKEKATCPLFVSTRNGKHVTKTQLAGRALYRIQDKAKVPKISFHGLRHTFAGFYIDKTGNVEALQKILGHADIRTTMIYLRRSRRYRPAPLELITHKSRTEPHLKAVGNQNN